MSSRSVSVKAEKPRGGRPRAPALGDVGRNAQLSSSRGSWSNGRFAGPVVIATLLAVITVGTFWEVRHHEFVLYDDTLYVTANPRVQQGLTQENFWWALTATEASNWHPLTWWSHMLDCQLFGLNGGAHHLTSLGLHVVSVLLLFGGLYEMTAGLWASAVVAALFAIHPQHVESVAYVGERKDVLSAVFWFLTIWAYARYARRPNLGRYALVAVSFGLGLMAKPMLVTLPCVLLLLDLWPLRRLNHASLRRLVVEKLPLFALAAAVSAVTFVAQRNAGSMAMLEERALAARIANALLAYATYIRKTFWPADLASFYPYPRSFDPSEVVLTGAALLAVSAAALILMRRAPYVAVGWFWFLGTLVPVLGLVQVGEQSMADRFTYIPLVGLFLTVTWSGADLFGNVRSARAGLAVVMLLAIGLCIVRTRSEVRHWRTSVTLFEHTVRVTTNNHVAHNNLGFAYREGGRTKEAMAQFAAALEASPRYATARNNIGLTQRDLGQHSEAIDSFREAIRLAPSYVDAHFNLGETLLLIGDLEHAAVEFQEAVRLDADDAPAHLLLSTTLLELGRTTEAVVHARRALVLQPNSPEAHLYLADGLTMSGHLDEAIQRYLEALRLRPDHTVTHYNIGNALARSGQVDLAIEHYTRAIVLNPAYPEAHNNLGKLLATKGRLDDALAHYSEALRLAPSLAPAWYNRGIAYQKKGELELAAADLARARELDPRFR